MNESYSKTYFGQDLQDNFECLYSSIKRIP